MNTIDLVTKLDKEICGGDLGRAAELLSDDFQFVGVAPKPLTKGEALGLWSAIRAGLPDFNHNLRDARVAGNIVYAVVEVTGTHQGALVVPHGPRRAGRRSRPRHASSSWRRARARTREPGSAHRP